MLGVFPLNIVVLPHEEVALHIFEPRYRELFQDHKNGNEFIILFSNKLGMSPFGTTVKVEKVIEEYPDGTIDLIVKGIEIIEVNQFHKIFPQKLYSGVSGNIIEKDENPSIKLLSYFQQYLESENKKNTKSVDQSVFHIANRIDLDQESKNKLLGLKTNNELNLFLINEIKFKLKIREQEIKLDNNYYLN